MYLNTPKQEDECVITSAEPFTKPLPSVDEGSTTKEILASMVGVYGINKYKACRTCSKKVTTKENLSFFEKTSKCTTEWLLQICCGNNIQVSGKHPSHFVQ